MYGSGAQLVREASARDSPWLNPHGRVGIEEVHLAMAQADVLMTIGNNSDSEVPSKLFEYLSFGKPIIHFYFSDHDEYLSYLDRYPRSLAVKIGGAFEHEDAISRITSFCLDGTHEEISMESVHQNFRECTPAFVGAQFLDAIRASSSEAS